MVTCANSQKDKRRRFSISLHDTNEEETMFIWIPLFQRLVPRYQTANKRALV